MNRFQALSGVVKVEVAKLEKEMGLFDGAARFLQEPLEFSDAEQRAAQCPRRTKQAALNEAVERRRRDA